MASRRRKLALTPALWTRTAPFGIGEQRPNAYREMLAVAWDNRAHPAYAYDVLTKGVCDGCALGVAGLHDWTIDGVHLCATRLRLLELNTADAIAPEVLADVRALRERSSTALRRLGRLGYPMRRRRGERGFQRISWSEALDVLTGAIRRAGADRTALYLTSRGLTNETYYAAAKAARSMGIANIDSAARVCHAPSTIGLKETIGVSASTCSLQDIQDSNLLVIWGANPANNQPVLMKHLFLARKRGLRVVVVNPVLEPGLDRYWVPSNAESAIFGTQMCDLHVPVRPGGDVALANATLKLLRERGALDETFIDAHTDGFEALCTALDGQDLDALCAQAGLSRAQVEAFAAEYAAADRAILLWSMGITQHTTGVDGVQAIVNLALARGNVGRDGAGLMPLRGHSGVQGGAEMGAYATALPGGVPVDAQHAGALAARWGFEVPDVPGLTAPEMVEAAARGALDVLWSSGGNFLEVLPDPERVAEALERVPLRVHQDIVLSSQMLLDGDDVLLLPVTTRYEQEGGGTETTTERRIVFSPEIPRQVGEARTEWRLFAEVASRVRPDVRATFAWADNAALRREIAEVVPLYAGIENLRTTGDQVQWGGRHLCVDGAFPTPTGRGRFSVLAPAVRELPDGAFLLATRRGKQFNSMVLAAHDPLTGAGRDAVLLCHQDATDLGVAAGDRVVVRSAFGELSCRVHIAEMAPRSAQVLWPEGNVLLPSGPAHREPRSGVPDDHVVVTIEVPR